MNDIKTLEGTLRAYPYVAAAYLFGSRARGNAGPTSDVDIAVLLKEGAPAGRALVHEMGYLAYKIGKVIGAREVDLVELNGKGLVFQHNVLRAGRLFYEADPQARVAFESGVISRFCDFEIALRAIEKLHIQGILKRCEALS